MPTRFVTKAEYGVRGVLSCQHTFHVLGFAIAVFLPAQVPWQTMCLAMLYLLMPPVCRDTVVVEKLGRAVSW
jgi:hypothetical protein